MRVSNKPVELDITLNDSSKLFLQLVNQLRWREGERHLNTEKKDMRLLVQEMDELVGKVIQETRVSSVSDDHQKLMAMVEDMLRKIERGLENAQHFTGPQLEVIAKKLENVREFLDMLGDQLGLTDDIDGSFRGKIDALIDRIDNVLGSVYDLLVSLQLATRIPDYLQESDDEFVVRMQTILDQMSPVRI